MRIRTDSEKLFWGLYSKKTRLHGTRVIVKLSPVIGSFGEDGTADIFHGRRTRRTRRYPPDVVRTAARKLDLINAAHVLRDLRSPPGNRLERLRGDWVGHHSIRVNDQWRIIFRWVEGSAHDVQLIDYHRG